MPTLTYVLYPTRFFLHTEYDRGRPVLSGSAAGEVSVTRLWGGSGGYYGDGSQEGAVWCRFQSNQIKPKDHKGTKKEGLYHQESHLYI